MDRRTLLSVMPAAFLPAIEGSASAQSIEAALKDGGGPIGAGNLSAGWVTPQDYYKGDWGAPGADHTSAMQAALESGSSILLPAGDINISQALRLQKRSGIVIRGAGRGLTRILQNSSNTGIFLIWGTRLRIEDFEVGWSKIQDASQSGSYAFKIWEKNGAGAILATSSFKNIEIRGAAIAFDMQNSIGFSNSFEDIDVSSFSIAVLKCDGRTAHTQSRFDAWHISNQPMKFISGAAEWRDSRSAKIDNSGAGSEDFVGSAIVFSDGSKNSGRVRWIVEHDRSTNIVRFDPQVDQPSGPSAQFSISYLGQAAFACMAFNGFTDLRLGMIAFEFLRLSANTPSPISFENCNVVSVDLLRFERINFGCSSSALISAAGRCVITVGGVQSQFSSALRGLGCDNIYLGRTYGEARIFFNTIECDNWQIDAVTRWSIASGGSRFRQLGGVSFSQTPIGDGSFAPKGQSYDVLGEQRQTAIIGRPDSSLRGASWDEGSGDIHFFNPMKSPDILRFDTPLEKDITVVMDQDDRVTGVRILILRTSKAAGPGRIIVKYSNSVIAIISKPTERVELVCHGEGYYLVE